MGAGGGRFHSGGVRSILLYIGKNGGRGGGRVRVPSRVGNKCNRVKGQGKIYENDVIKK